MKAEYRPFEIEKYKKKMTTLGEVLINSSGYRILFDIRTYPITEITFPEL